MEKIDGTITFDADHKSEQRLTIDPFHISRHEGIEIFHSDFSYSNLLGVVKKKEKSVTFYLNLYAEDVWQRFAVAHMLGHYFYDLASAEDMRLYCRRHLSSDHSNKRESVADQFARQLLLPEKAVKAYLAESADSSASLLAFHFHVPTTIAQIRMQDLLSSAGQIGQI
ncbi:MAG: ImmA/IrrE family metallo-endopeptidase [Sporolactobacillus sp.]